MIAFPWGLTQRQAFAEQIASGKNLLSFESYGLPSVLGGILEGFLTNRTTDRWVSEYLNFIYAIPLGAEIDGTIWYRLVDRALDIFGTAFELARRKEPKAWVYNLMPTIEQLRSFARDLEVPSAELHFQVLQLPIKQVALATVSDALFDPTPGKASLAIQGLQQHPVMHYEYKEAIENALYEILANLPVNRELVVEWIPPVGRLLQTGTNKNRQKPPPDA